MIGIGFLIALSGSSADSKVLFGLGNLVIAFGFLGILNLYILVPGTAYFQGKMIPWMEGRYRATLAMMLRGRNPAGAVPRAQASALGDARAVCLARALPQRGLANKSASHPTAYHHEQMVHLIEPENSAHWWVYLYHDT